jgi:hypothetical protein
MENHHPRPTNRSWGFLMRSIFHTFGKIEFFSNLLVEKWAREAFLTLPGIRVFLIDDLRNGGDENKAHGVNEVRLTQGSIVREGLHTT